MLLTHYFEVGWVLKFWGVMFLVVPPKDMFIDTLFSNAINAL
jgi:hypothetical protein